MSTTTTTTTSTSTSTPAATATLGDTPMSDPLATKLLSQTDGVSVSGGVRGGVSGGVSGVSGVSGEQVVPCAPPHSACKRAAEPPVWGDGGEPTDSVYESKRAKGESVESVSETDGQQRVSLHKTPDPLAVYAPNGAVGMDDTVHVPEPGEAIEPPRIVVDVLVAKLSALFERMERGMSGVSSGGGGGVYGGVSGVQSGLSASESESEGGARFAFPMDPTVFMAALEGEYTSLCVTDEEELVFYELVRDALVSSAVASRCSTSGGGVESGSGGSGGSGAGSSSVSTHSAPKRDASALYLFARSRGADLAARYASGCHATSITSTNATTTATTATTTTTNSIPTTPNDTKCAQWYGGSDFPLTFRVLADWLVNQTVQNILLCLAQVAALREPVRADVIANALLAKGVIDVGADGLVRPRSSSRRKRVNVSAYTGYSGGGRGSRGGKGASSSCSSSVSGVSGVSGASERARSSSRGSSGSGSESGSGDGSETHSALSGDERCRESTSTRALYGSGGCERGFADHDSDMGEDECGGYDSYDCPMCGGALADNCDCAELYGAALYDDVDEDDTAYYLHTAKWRRLEE